MEITYVVGRAGWRPLYDMRLRETNGSAVVAFQSGQRSPKIPEARLDGRQTRRFHGSPGIEPADAGTQAVVCRRAPAATASVQSTNGRQERANGCPGDGCGDEAPPMAAMAPAPVVAEVEMAQAEESWHGCDLRVSGDVDIPGDGTPKRPPSVTMI